MADALKTYFAVPTAAEMLTHKRADLLLSPLKDHHADVQDTVNGIIALRPDEVAILHAALIPSDYTSARKFMKHGSHVQLPRRRSLEEAVAAHHTPLDDRRQAFNAIARDTYRGYTFGPLLSERHGDQRIRQVALYECMQGAWLYSYADQPAEGHQFQPKMTVKPYDDAKRVAHDGADIVVQVPSRTEGRGSYQFKFMGVPVVDTSRKWSLAARLSTDHPCPSKRFNRIRYTRAEDKASSREFNFCAHEIAGYLAIADYYWNEKENVIPLQMNPFALPSRLAAEFYIALHRATLIKPSKDAKPRRLNWAEEEILLWAFTKFVGHDAALIAKKRRDGDLRSYPWQQAA